MSLAELKKQIEDANSLGRENLNAKGVTTNGAETTYQIMELIASVSSGECDGDHETSGETTTHHPLEYATDLSNAFKNATFTPDYELTLHISSSLTTMASAFYPSSNVKKITIVGGDKENQPVVNFNSAFRDSANLEVVDMTGFKGKISNAGSLFWFNSAIQHIYGELDFSKCTNFSNAFNTANLVTITPKEESIMGSISFASCGKLSAESVDAIINGLHNFDEGEDAQTLTMSKSITISDEQKAIIEGKGWTLAQ